MPRKDLWLRGTKEPFNSLRSLILSLKYLIIPSLKEIHWKNQMLSITSEVLSNCYLAVSEKGSPFAMEQTVLPVPRTVSGKEE